MSQQIRPVVPAGEDPAWIHMSLLAAMWKRQCVQPLLDEVARAHPVRQRELGQALHRRGCHDVSIVRAVHVVERSRRSCMAVVRAQVTCAHAWPRDATLRPVGGWHRAKVRRTGSKASEAAGKTAKTGASEAARTAMTGAGEAARTAKTGASEAARTIRARTASGRTASGIRAAHRTGGAGRTARTGDIRAGRSDIRASRSDIRAGRTFRGVDCRRQAGSKTVCPTPPRSSHSAHHSSLCCCRSSSGAGCERHCS